MTAREPSSSPLFLTALLPVVALLHGAPLAAEPPAPGAREVTILYTNDFHSAIDPIPAYWLTGTPKLGGAAQLTTLIRRERAAAKTPFLFDTGDAFTGTLSFLSRGEALTEVMALVGYDAMALGNHEFDYGSDVCERRLNEVPFPVLGGNIYHKGTKHRFARPHTILERDGLRVGVVGVIGLDARSVILPKFVENLDFGDPVEEVRRSVEELRPKVDLIVVLTHQGKTGPMQTDAEAHPEIQRDVEEDLRLAGAVPGIDVLIGGHAHRGIETPIVHPKTGTLVLQTYGYGTRLGILRLRLEGGKVVGHSGELLKVWSDQLPPDPAVEKRLEPWRKKLAAEAGEAVGTTQARFVRNYVAESVLGNYVTDVMREKSGANVGITNAGGLRADLPEGTVRRANVLDALPFVNSLVTLEMTGAQLREVIEQGLTLERGMVQVSGVLAKYDLGRPSGSRLVSLAVGGKPVDDARTYTVATNSFLAQGGDLYATFPRCKVVADSGQLLSATVVEALRAARGTVPLPIPGRLVPVAGR